jgi:hypothetical protein
MKMRISFVPCLSDLFCQRVAAAGGDCLGRLETATAPVAFPLRLMRVPQTVAPRLALVGDAAHGIHPLSGHGINLGFQDASELAALLAAAQPWQDIGDERFLQRYQRARREETALMQTTTDSLRRLFRAAPPGLARPAQPRPEPHQPIAICQNRPGALCAGRLLGELNAEETLAARACRIVRRAGQR